MLREKEVRSIVKKGRQTIQRQMVLGAVQHLKNHPTAEDVYEMVIQEYPNISRATVYRNLNLLAENGVIRSVELPDSAIRFDDRLSQHFHFRCRCCGKVTDIEMPYRQELDKQAQNDSKLLIEGHEVVFKGLCEKCQKKEKVRNKA